MSCAKSLPSRMCKITNDANFWLVLALTAVSNRQSIRICNKLVAAAPLPLPPGRRLSQKKDKSQGKKTSHGQLQIAHPCAPVLRLQITHHVIRAVCRIRRHMCIGGAVVLQRGTRHNNTTQARHKHINMTYTTLPLC
jgi:hypothetical protein